MPKLPPPNPQTRVAIELDDAIQSAVLGHLIDLHPVQLTLDELVREMTDTPDDFAIRDQLARAVQQLVRTGLLHTCGPFVVPTRAALRAAELGPF
jgi:hypothetical protein